MKRVVDVATVTKLTRNLFIIVIIPLVSYLYYKNLNANADAHVKKDALLKWKTFIPFFVIGFLLFALLRPICDVRMTNSGTAFGFIPPSNWENIYTYGSSFGTTFLLGMAMAGVGLSTDFKMFKGIRIKPFYIGF